MKVIQWMNNPPVNGAKSLLLLRLMAGGVFLWEGVLKFVYANQGVGRFVKLGFPVPELTANFVGIFEMAGGILLLTGALTRWMAVPFMLEMLVAMATTKIALYFGNSPLALPSSPPQVGIWAVLHEIRSEYAQLLTTAFLALNGPGTFSLDAWISRHRALVRTGNLGLPIQKSVGALLGFGLLACLSLASVSTNAQAGALPIRIEWENSQSGLRLVYFRLSAQTYISAGLADEYCARLGHDPILGFSQSMASLDTLENSIEELQRTPMGAAILEDPAPIWLIIRSGHAGRSIGRRIYDANLGIFVTIGKDDDFGALGSVLCSGRAP